MVETIEEGRDADNGLVEEEDPQSIEVECVRLLDSNAMDDEQNPETDDTTTPDFSASDVSRDCTRDGAQMCLRVGTLLVLGGTLVMSTLLFKPPYFMTNPIMMEVRSSSTTDYQDADDPTTRPIQFLGKSTDFVPVNADQREERVQNMRDLDIVRFGHCGGFELVVEAVRHGKDPNTAGAHWQPHHDASERSGHCADGQAYKTKQNCDPSMPISRFVCEAPHPTMQGVTITIDRMGPFVGTGGYDWSFASVQNVGNLKETLLERDGTFVGGMVAPIYTNGTILSNPPIHIHHALVFPYGDWEERGRKIIGSEGDHHDVLFQSHGDSECLDKDGGSSCLLYQLNDGRGFVVHNDTSGISAEFKLNDVRPKGSPKMEYWFEVTLLHRRDLPTAGKSTFVGLNNPCFGPGSCTYMLPMDPHHSAMWYQYIHGNRSTQLSSGTMADFILHSHQNMFDSAFLIKSKDDNVFKALESYRANKPLPLILDCHHRGVGLEEAKMKLLARVKEQGGQLICEATKPSLKFVPAEHGDAQGYEKRAKLNCRKDPVDLDVGDRLVVLTFNTVHKSDYARDSKEFESQNAFSDFFAAYQHTIFRFTLTYTDKSIRYAPPSYFYYADLGEDLDPNRFYPDTLITGTCPRTIKFIHVRRGWTDLFSNWIWT